MKHSKRAKNLALTAGALAAGMAGCTETIYCDPPPPPLCDRLDRESPLTITADRDTIPAGQTATFTGTVTDTTVSMIERIYVDATVGQVSEIAIQPPRSFTFRWGPSGAMVQVWITVQQEVQGILNGKTDTCWLYGEIALHIDGQGTAVIDSLPGPNQPLAVHFDVHVAAGLDGDAVLLKAIPTLTPEESQRATYRWRASGGTIDPTGDQARFVPASDGAPAVVQVEVVLDGSSLAVGVWEWPRP